MIINYVKRSEVRGTWLDSHFSWQIRTFWIGVIVAIIGLLTCAFSAAFTVLSLRQVDAALRGLSMGGGADPIDVLSIYSLPSRLVFASVGFTSDIGVGPELPSPVPELTARLRR